MKTGKNLLKSAMLILVSIIISQSAMAENFPTNEYFLHGDWDTPIYANKLRLYQDHTMKHLSTGIGGTWSYDASTGTVIITNTPNVVYNLVVESRIKMSGPVLDANGEVKTEKTLLKVQINCGEEDYNNDGSFDINDFIDNENDVKNDFEIRRQNLDTEIERQNLDKELETELAKIHEELRSCWTQKCD